MDLQQLRQGLTDDQRAILNFIWEEHQKRHGWVPVRVVHLKFGKQPARVALGGLGGSIVRTQSVNAPQEVYELSFIGALLTDQGREAEDLLIRYLTYVRSRFLADPEIGEIKSAEVRNALEIEGLQLSLLGELIMLGNLWGNSAGGQGENWGAGVPGDVDDFPAIDDFRSYVEQQALAHYDPFLPLDERERWQYDVQKRREEVQALQSQSQVVDSTPAASARETSLFDNILLDPEQEELLATLVEARKSVSREKRRPFILSRTNRGDQAILGGQGRSLDCPISDYQILLREGLLHVVDSREEGNTNFDITPLGNHYYEYAKIRSGEPVERVESELRSYLNAERFKKKYPEAYRKWLEAEQLLWSSDSEHQFTTIGHLCRETMQEFADGLVKQYQLLDAPEEKERTFARVKAVLEHRKQGLGERKKELLDALLVYWDKSIELIQRQEHGSLKHGDPLTWEDGRRAVFQTAIVIFEIDRALS